MEESYQNENIINNNDEIYLNDCNGRKKNGRRVWNSTKFANRRKKLENFEKISIFKEKNANMIVEMHYVGHFIV